MLHDVHLKPYRLQLVQELHPLDYAHRLSLLHLVDGGNRIAVFDNFFFSDEAWFHLDGFVNAQNYHIWSAEWPHEYWVMGLHPAKIREWCAILQCRIVGPIFFTITVTAEIYRGTATQFIALLEANKCNCLFQQDGVPAHMALCILAFLDKFLGERLICSHYGCFVVRK